MSLIGLTLSFLAIEYGLSPFDTVYVFDAGDLVTVFSGAGLDSAGIVFSVAGAG